VAQANAGSPLADAAQKKNFDAVQSLLEQQEKVNTAQGDGMTALHWAVYHDDLDVTKRLIKAGADVKAKNRYGVMPLSLACTNGNGEIVELLIDAGADPNATNAGGETVLMTAARTGRRQPVEILLAHKADVNAKERKGQTAIMWAAAEGHAEVVDALIEAGAEFRTPLPSGFTPFFFAIREGRIDVVRRLLAAGIDVNEAMRPERSADRGLSPLLLAVENGHFELANALLEAGADPNAQPSGFAALHAMSWVRRPVRGDGNPAPIGSGNMSSLEFVRRLVEHGADVNAKLKKGRSGRAQFTTTGASPFLLATWNSDLPLMRLLLERGADPSLTNADGSTALIVATGIGDLGSGDELPGSEDEALEAVRLLLDRGADVNAVDENGETAMHGASYQNRPKVVQLLTESGADVAVWNRKNKWGWTPLMIAEGHRLGNFRPSPDTIAAIRRAMLDAGVTPPVETPAASGKVD
jgi:ankyrin repeat protein